MNWTDDPATWKQLKYLKQCGYQLDHRLTKSEANDIITRLGGPSDDSPGGMVEVQPATTAYDLHAAIVKTSLALEQAQRSEFEALQKELEAAVAARQGFWLDTCRGTAKNKTTSSQLLELYRKYGCLFCDPTAQQIQDILDALDAAMPLWDRDHLELFYEALGLNFPQLRKHT